MHLHLIFLDLGRDLQKIKEIKSNFISLRNKDNEEIKDEENEENREQFYERVKKFIDHKKEFEFIERHVWEVVNEQISGRLY